MQGQYLHEITDTRNTTLLSRNFRFNLLFEAWRHWPWFLLSVSLCSISAFIFLRYATPEFKITASLLIRDDSRGTDFGDAALLESLGLSNVKSSVDNEVQLLKSRTLMEEVVRDLQLYIRYYAIGKLKTTEIYEKSPYKLTLLQPNPISRKTTTYRLSPVGIHRYQLTFDSQTLNGFFGDTLLLPNGLAVIRKTAYQPALYDQYSIVISNPLDPVQQCISALTVSATNKMASIVDLEMDEAIPAKGEEILKQLLANYLKASINDKNRMTDSTLSFIDENLKTVSFELTGIERKIEIFRKANRLTNPEENARFLIQNATKVTQDERNYLIQLQIVESLLHYIKEASDHIIPSSLQINDPQFAALALKYNEIQLSKEKMLAAATGSHPIIQTLDVQLRSLRADLLTLMYAQKKGLEVSIAALDRYHSEDQSQINRIPETERIYHDYSREQEIKQELYLFLLKKRVETSISRSSTVPNARIIDPPKSNPDPVNPNRQLVLLISGFLGLGIPFATLHLKSILNTTINSKAEFQQNCNVPVLAEIGYQVIKSIRQNHLILEQFRVLRTHIQFLSANVDSRTILVTSGMGGEGKSFVAVNLAHSFALSGKRVILLELDLRKPKLAKSLDLNDIGFTSFMIEDKPISQYIQKTNGDDAFDMLVAGPSPPNPAEILSFQKVSHMMIYMKKNYDLIIIDTPPVGLVTDGRLLGQYADLTLYIIRQGFSRQHQIESIQEIYDKKQLPGFYTIFNGVQNVPGYGYGYYEEKPTTWRHLKAGKKWNSWRKKDRV